MKNKNIVIVSIILFSLIGLFPIRTIGQFADIEYTFEKEIYLDDLDITSYNETFNLRTTTTFTDIYNGTESFTNLPLGTANLSIPFISAITGSDTNKTAVIVNHDSHNKVLRVSSNGNNGENGLFGFNLNRQYGNASLEYWCKHIDKGAGELQLKIFGAGGTAMRIDFNSNPNPNRFEVVHGGGTSFTSINSNLWYHVRIEWSVLSNTYSVWLNSLPIALNVNFSANLKPDYTTSGRLQTTGAGGSNNLVYYLDAFGYSWDKTFTNITTFDFENDTLGVIPNYWYNISVPLSSAVVVSRDNSNQLATAKVSGTGGCFQNFTEQSFGTLNFQFQTDYSDSGAIEYILGNNTEYAIRIYLIHSSDNFIIRAFNVSGFITAITNLNYNQTYNISIVFRCSNSDYYKGLSEQTYSLYLNESLLGIYEYHDDYLQENINQFTISMEDQTGNDPILWTDNITYSWNNTIQNYNDNDNFIPYMIRDNTLLETDKIEFALNNTHSLRYIGSSEYPNGWIETPVPNPDTYIDQDPTNINNRIIHLALPNGGTGGFRKDDFNLTHNLINVSVGIVCKAIQDNDINAQDQLQLFLYAYDGTIMLVLEFVDNGTLLVHNNLVSTGYSIYDNLQNDTLYELNCFLDYSSNTVFIKFYVSGILNFTHFTQLTVQGALKTGLMRVNLLADTFGVGNATEYHIYYVGVYGNGLSYCNELGYSIIDPNNNNNDWNSLTQNIFSITGSGIFSLGMIEYPYNISANSSYSSIKGFNEHIDLKTYNSYDITPIIYNNTPMIIFYVINGSFNISNINVDGVKIIEGINEFPLIYSHNGIDIHNSYFYVDSNNRLQFTCTANDSGLEYIQALFQINKEFTNDTNIGWNSIKSGTLIGNIRLNYTDDTSSVYELQNSYISRKVILPNDKTYREIIFLITDNNLALTGTTTGYITNLILQYTPNIIITIITLSLINMMIPLIVILIPSIAISEKTSKSLLTPLFLIMSIICTITNLIPMWLFFIIAISNSIFIFKNKSREFQ